MACLEPQDQDTGHILHSAFFLQPLLHKQAGPLSEPCRLDAASPQATQTTFLLCLISSPKDTSGRWANTLGGRGPAYSHGLLRATADRRVQVCTYSPAPTAGEYLSWLPVWWRRAARQWGAMRHSTSKPLKRCASSIPYRHSMQPYVPVGCAPCKQHLVHALRAEYGAGSRTVPIGGMR